MPRTEQDFVLPTLSPVHGRQGWMSLHIQQQRAAEAEGRAGWLTLYTAEPSFGFVVGMRSASFLSNKTESTTDRSQVEASGVLAKTTWNLLPTPTTLTG